MRNSQSGIVSYIGSSRDAYYIDLPPWFSSHFYYTILFNKRYVSGLFQSNIDVNNNIDNLKTKHLGKIVDFAKKGWNLERKNEIDKKLYYSVNTLGDPEMPIYTQHPMLFDSVSCQIDSINNKVIVNTSVADTRLHIISNGKLYETVGTTYELPMMSKDSIEFVLTNQNYIPTLFTPFKTTKYIQNETISENTSHTGYDYIKVGRNVDITKPFGNVVVSSGKSLILKANKEIEIRNNFEVSSGSEFIMDVEP